MTKEEFIAARQSLGLFQADLAKRLGMSTRGVQAIENGSSPVRMVHMLALETIRRDKQDSKADGLDRRVRRWAVETISKHLYLGGERVVQDAAVLTAYVLNGTVPAEGDGKSYMEGTNETP